MLCVNLEVLRQTDSCGCRGGSSCNLGPPLKTEEREDGPGLKWIRNKDYGPLGLRQ